jgi:hypothetical protein
MWTAPSESVGRRSGERHMVCLSAVEALARPSRGSTRPRQAALAFLMWKSSGLWRISLAITFRQPQARFSGRQTVYSARASGLRNRRR